MQLVREIWPQLSQLAEPLWTDLGQKSGISVCKLISSLKKKKKEEKKRAGGEWIVEHSPQKSLQAKKNPPPPPRWAYDQRKILRIFYKDHVTNEEVHAKVQQAI